MTTSLHIIAQLEATRDQTLAFFALPNDALELTYAPGKWTVRYLLHHLADAESVLFDRIRRVLSEPRQVIWAFDQDAWASGLDYSTTPLALSSGVYQSVRAAVIHYADRYYTEKGHLEFVHSATGIRTLKDEFDKVAWHNQHHLNQILTALTTGKLD